MREGQISYSVGGRTGAAFPHRGAVAKQAEVCGPLDRNKQADADGMKQRAEERLAETDGGDEAREECGDDGKGSECQCKRGRGESQNDKRQHLAAEQKQRCGDDELRRAQAFVRVLGEAVPDIGGAQVHATMEGVGGVKEIGSEVAGAEDARERNRVVNPIGNGGVTACLFVGFAADSENLTAGGCETWVSAGSHAFQREKTEQDKVDQRNDELLHETAGLFARNAARERGAALLHERCQPRNE